METHGVYDLLLCHATHATVAAGHALSPVRRQRAGRGPIWKLVYRDRRERSRGCACEVLCNTTCEAAIYRGRNEPAEEPKDTGRWTGRSLALVRHDGHGWLACPILATPVFSIYRTGLRLGAH